MFISCPSYSALESRRFRASTSEGLGLTGPALSGSPHPELVQQNAPLRAVLVVADPLRDEAEDLGRARRNDGRLVGEFSIDLRPQRVRGGLIGRLQPQRPIDLGVESAFAELRP